MSNDQKYQTQAGKSYKMSRGSHLSHVSLVHLLHKIWSAPGLSLATCSPSCNSVIPPCQTLQKRSLGLKGWEVIEESCFENKMQTSILSYKLWEADWVEISFNASKQCWFNLKMWAVLHFPLLLKIINSLAIFSILDIQYSSPSCISLDFFSCSTGLDLFRFLTACLEIFLHAEAKNKCHHGNHQNSFHFVGIRLTAYCVN